MATVTNITLERSFAFNVIQPMAASEVPRGCLTVEEFGKETRRKLKAYCQEYGIS